MEDRIDELFETLIIEKINEQALSVPYGGFNASWAKYVARTGKNNWAWRYPVGGFDEVYKNAEGKFHRIYGPAYISRRYRVEIWYKDGNIHREDGPALTHKQNYMWFKEGKLHRLNGPAIDILGHPKEYYIDGAKYSPKEYRKEIARRRRKGKL